MIPSPLDRIAALVLEEKAAPAAAVGVAYRQPAGTFRVGIGSAGHGIDANKAVFDLASVTKPLVATAAARLSRRGVLDLAAPLATYVPELRNTPAGPVPLILFLAHRAGLEAHRPLFAPLREARAFVRAHAVRSAAEARRSDAAGPPPPDGFAPLYSDLGYVLAGTALERAEGAPLDEIVEREVARPLGLDARSARLWARCAPDFMQRVLPTESVTFRGPIRGAVHDENAWALSGHGLSGHAGLFGTVSAVVGFGVAVLDALAGRNETWLRASEVAALVAPRPLGSLRAGFDGKSGPSSAAGDRASPETFGHLGFTGTSLWCDPRAERVTVLLTNRVHPTRDNLRIRAVRPRIHDALHAWDEGLSLSDQA
jgi:CubicO group peptidase (beta-lactamase class C family)